MSTVNELDNIYEAFCSSDEYEIMTKDIQVNFEWLMEKLQSKDYIRLENDVMELIALNDKVLFESGFNFAWRLFHQCNSKQKVVSE